MFINTFKTHYDKHCHIKEKHIYTYNNKPWFTNGLKHACRKKNHLHKVFLKKRAKGSEEKYKQYKNKLTSILRFCEKSC